MASIDDHPAPLLLVVGPTGVGKSDLALALAERLDGEIVSADSRQVYRGMPIGTAQPSPAELSRVPHHLVGVLAPDEPFSAAQFVDAAEGALAEIRARGRLPIVVGGTHHYVQALFEGLDLPRVPPDWAFRQDLEREAAEQGAESLHQRLAKLDPRAAEQIPAANTRRVIRALEVIARTGQRFSEVGRRKGPSRPAARLAVTMPRSELYARVDARVDEMLRRGWLDEIRTLLAAGFAPDLPALTSTGYRELTRYLQGEIELDEATQLVKYSTHGYIRRQYAWLRRLPSLTWLEQGQDLVDRALARVGEYFEDQALCRTT